MYDYELHGLVICIVIHSRIIRDMNTVKSETDFIWKRRIEKISRKKPREKIGGILRVLTKNEGQPQMEC